MYNIRIHITTKSNIHNAAYLTALITTNTWSYTPGTSFLREPGQIGIRYQCADHLHAICLLFCQYTFSLCCAHDAPGCEDRDINNCFDCACQVDCITQRNVHRGIEREHLS